MVRGKLKANRLMLILDGNAIHLAAFQCPRLAQAPPLKSEVSRTCPAHAHLLACLGRIQGSALLLQKIGDFNSRLSILRCMGRRPFALGR